MTPPVVGVLAIQGDVREHLRVLEACGARAVAVGSARALASVEALVIPGGESTTMSRLAILDGRWSHCGMPEGPGCRCTDRAPG